MLALKRGKRAGSRVTAPSVVIMTETNAGALKKTGCFDVFAVNYDKRLALFIRNQLILVNPKLDRSLILL
jgi:hypothetical protein